jgi:hypothetical protein
MVAATDPDRLGGLEWTRRTRGQLSPRERRRLLVAIAAGQVENVIGRAKLALGRRRSSAVDARAFAPPDSRLAREAEAACAEQPPALVAHSYRTWMFGRVLSIVDGSELDPELFYCAALVHDYGIVPSVRGRDFTLGGAERVLACGTAAGLAPTEASKIADAICVHATPGISVDRDGALGCYVQWGAMVDVAGLRLWDITAANVDAILGAHPRRPGFKDELARLIRDEAAAVPKGRFALLVRCGLLLAVRHAPFAD